MVKKNEKKEEKEKKDQDLYYWELKIGQAVAVFVNINLMAGAGAAKTLRSKIQDKIKKVFPEALRADEEENEEDIEPKKYREVKITKREMSAFVHGIIDFCNDKETKGGDFANMLEMAKWCKIYDHVTKQLHPERFENFDGELDGEGLELDK